MTHSILNFLARKAALPVICVLGALTGSASAAVFGPDAFGYTGNSSNSPASFTTIKGAGGALVTPADPANALFDDRFYAATIPFNFPFYGVNQTAAFLSTNGFISFGGTTNTNAALNTQVASSFGNNTLASATALIAGMQVDRSFIAPWWDDLQFTNAQAGGIYTLTRTLGVVQEFVVEWNSVAFFNSTTDSVNFQAILRDDGSMTFLYRDVLSSNAGNTRGGSATIGIHNLGGTTGNNNFLQYSFNQAAALANGDRIDITLIPEPGSMALAAGSFAGMLLRRRRR